MIIRKMEFADLKIVNEKFLFGKNLNTKTLKSDYIYML